MKKLLHSLTLIVIVFMLSTSLVFAKANYTVVDSCDEYSYGPKKHQGYCECYDDPYYYCAFFPGKSAYVTPNKQIIEYNIPMSFTKQANGTETNYHVIYKSYN